MESNQNPIVADKVSIYPVIEIKMMKNDAKKQNDNNLWKSLISFIDVNIIENTASNGIVVYSARAQVVGWAILVFSCVLPSP
ncbi:hypothetical protein B4U84_30240 [Westiellopsis prolifica IICB1]|nr:hypothetical protein B4U84_30240 [Westiellopsis prolifica IICB1]